MKDKRNKRNKKDKKRLPTIYGCGQAVAEILEHQTDGVMNLIVKLNEAMLAEHKLELEDCRKQSDGQMPQLWVDIAIFSVDEDIRERADPVWAVDVDETDSFDSRWVRSEGYIEGGLDGEKYHPRDFERAIPKLAKWEIRLIWKYERRVSVLRKYLRDLQSLATGLMCFMGLPRLENLRPVNDNEYARYT